MDTTPTPDYAPSMESRIAVLEEIASSTKSALLRIEAAQVKADDRARGDFRILFGATITATIALAGMIAHVAHWL